MPLYVLSYPCDTREILKREKELVFHNEQNILLKEVCYLLWFTSLSFLMVFIPLFLYWCVNCPW